MLLTTDIPGVDPGLTTRVEACRRRVHSAFGRELGILQGTWWRNRYGESPLGNWVTDALRHRAGTDVAFMNSGGIRKNLGPGPIRLLDVNEILPFTNRLVTFELSGAQLAAVIRENARAAMTGDHGILQVSGLRYAYRGTAVDDLEVVESSVGGKPLDRSRVYRCAAPDYVLSKAPYYFALEAPDFTDMGVTITKVMVEAVERAKRIEPALDGRIRWWD